MTLRTPAQSNSLFADALDPSNIGCRRSIFAPGDDRAGDSEIVIAIRYLRAEGIRHSQMLNHVRYARENTAAICYGFSMYRTGKNPAVITLRRTSDSEE